MPIDPSGEMHDVEALGAGTTAPFSSLPTLAATLASSDAAASCFAAQWLRFARGDREGPADHCALQTLRERFGQSGGDVRALLIGLTQLEGFTRRRMAP